MDSSDELVRCYFVSASNGENHKITVKEGDAMSKEEAKSDVVYLPNKEMREYVAMFICEEKRKSDLVVETVMNQSNSINNLLIEIEELSP